MTNFGMLFGYVEGFEKKTMTGSENFIIISIVLLPRYGNIFASSNDAVQIFHF
jgi:hypothetical protein